MSTADFIKKAWPKLIVATGDPTAPIVLQEAYGATMRLGQMLAATSNQTAVDEITTALMSKWTDSALNNISSKPEFVIALCAMLSQSIIEYTNQTAR